MDQTDEVKSMKPFFVMWGGQAISLLGSQLVQFALIWWLTETTRSATVLAMASLVGLLPQVVLGPFVGVLVDRWNRRITMMTADTFVAAATVVLAYLFWIESVQAWHVFLILFVRALAGAFHFPAVMASTTLMVPKKQLTRIQGLNQALNGGLNIASGPLGALLLAVMPMQGILAIDVVTALCAIGSLFFIQVPQPVRGGGRETAVSHLSTSFWADLRAGFRYLRTLPGVLIIVGMAMIIKILLNPAFALVPLLVTNHFGGDALQLGLLESAVGAGLILGGALLSVWGGFKRRIMTMLCGVVGVGMSMLLLGLVPASLFALAIVAVLAVGITISLTDGPLLALLQAVVAPDMQGRVFTLFSSLVSSTAPLGLIIAGPVADMVGVRFWFVAAGIVTIAAGATSFFIPAVMEMERDVTTADIEVEKVDRVAETVIS